MRAACPRSTWPGMPRFRYGVTPSRDIWAKRHAFRAACCDWVLYSGADMFGKVPGVVADPFRRGRSRSAWLSWRLTSGGGRAAFSLSANSRGTR